MSSVIKSLFINAIDVSFTADDIMDVFYCQDIATISRVTLVPFLRGDGFLNRAYLDIHEWHTTESAYNFIQRLKDSNREARIIHSDDNWWAVKVNKKSFITNSTKMAKFTTINYLLVEGSFPQCGELDKKELDKKDIRPLACCRACEVARQHAEEQNEWNENEWNEIQELIYQNQEKEQHAEEQHAKEQHQNQENELYYYEQENEWKENEWKENEWNEMKDLIYQNLEKENEWKENEWNEIKELSEMLAYEKEQHAEEQNEWNYYQNLEQENEWNHYQNLEYEFEVEEEEEKDFTEFPDRTREYQLCL